MSTGGWGRKNGVQQQKSDPGDCPAARLFPFTNPFPGHIYRWSQVISPTNLPKIRAFPIKSPLKTTSTDFSRQTHGFHRVSTGFPWGFHGVSTGVSTGFRPVPSTLRFLPQRWLARDPLGRCLHHLGSRIATLRAMLNQRKWGLNPEELGSDPVRNWDLSHLSNPICGSRMNMWLRCFITL